MCMEHAANGTDVQLEKLELEDSGVTGANSKVTLAFLSRQLPSQLAVCLT